jgi:gamma-glutamylcyclotransferase (GGCT)/AIG2-like uncharacterized protein YtfP
MRARPAGVLVIGWAEVRLESVGPSIPDVEAKDVVIRNYALYMFQGDAALSRSDGSVVYSRILIATSGQSLFPLIYRGSMMTSPRKIFVEDADEARRGVAVPTEYLVECDESLFPSYFSAQRVYHIPDGRWSSLSLFPLVNNIPLRDVRHIFAYGTLRPDDKSGAHWTAKFSEGMNWEPGFVRNVDLGMLQYPVVVIPSEPDAHHSGVHGCLLWCDSEALFRSKLRDADSIEGTPRLYQRGIVMVHPTNETERDVVPAFIYFRTPQDLSEPVALIPSGDFCNSLTRH